jgi:sec-independent protein translocase protein TatA
MLGSVGPTELIIILLIVMIFFGVGKLGEVGGAMGKGIREFKKASTGEYDALTDEGGKAEAASEPAKSKVEIEEAS